MAVAAGAWLIRRLERGGQARGGLRVGLWIVAAAPLAVPVLAFASGFGARGARDTLPEGATAAAPGAADGITAALDAPAGRWEVLAHPGSAITARVSAGGEAFDARLAGGLSGTWTGDPGALGTPMQAAITVATASVDTGIAMRSKSAREDYLQAGRYPTLTFRLTRLLAARQDGPALIAFRAAGELDFVGATLTLEITGTLRVLDEAARLRLQLDATTPALLAEADFAIPIGETALAPDAGDFDGDHIPVHVALLLAHRP